MDSMDGVHKNDMDKQEIYKRKRERRGHGGSWLHLAKKRCIDEKG